MNSLRIMCLTGFAGLLLNAGNVVADDILPADDGFAAFDAVPEDSLESLRAREGNFGLNVLDQTVTLNGNQEGDAGDVNVSGNAFSGVTGISTMLFNTGNNVAMGSEMIVNVYINSNGP